MSADREKVLEAALRESALLVHRLARHAQNFESCNIAACHWAKGVLAPPQEKTQGPRRVCPYEFTSVPGLQCALWDGHTGQHSTDQWRVEPPALPEPPRAETLADTFNATDEPSPAEPQASGPECQECGGLGYTGNSRIRPCSRGCVPPAPPAEERDYHNSFLSEPQTEAEEPKEAPKHSATCDFAAAHGRLRARDGCVPACTYPGAPVEVASPPPVEPQERCGCRVDCGCGQADHVDPEPQGGISERLWDLVRQQRGELLEAGLITDEEYASLAMREGAVPRLESYDGLREEIQQLTRERDHYRDSATVGFGNWYEEQARVRTLEREAFAWKITARASKASEEAAEAKVRTLEEERDLYRDFVVRAVEAASPLQTGGKYGDMLRLGESTVHCGIPALIARMEAAEAKLRVYEEGLARWKAEGGSRSWMWLEDLLARAAGEPGAEAKEDGKVFS